MENLKQNDELIIEEEKALHTKMQRRSFLRFAGAGAATVGLFAAACKNDPATGSLAPTTIDVGSGDTGVLNFAYTLEQIEAAFYTQVIATPYSGITPAELSGLTDIRDHEVLHREFLKTALGTSAIPALSFNFSSINFNDRTSVLTAAKNFEDTGTAAYNGSGYLLQSATNLGLAGKIVSVEARQAAYLRDMLNYNTFADNTVLDGNALEISKKPSQILPIAAMFLTVTVTANQLP